MQTIAVRFRRPRSLPLLLCSVWFACFCTIILFRPGGDAAMPYLANLGQIVAPAAAAVAGFARARRKTDRRLRLGWRLVGVGAATYAAGQAMWSYYELAAGTATPFPSWADVGFVGSHVFLLAGMVVLFPDRRQGAWRLSAALDSLLAVGALLLLVWMLLIEPTLTAGGMGVLAMCVALANPLFDVATATVALRAVGSHSDARRSIGFVAAALLTLGAVNIAYFHLLNIGRYATGHVIDPLWVAAFLLIVVGAQQPRTNAAAPGARAGLARVLVPYVPLVVVAPVFVWQSVTAGTSAISVALAALLVLCVLARQLAMLVESWRLARTLEERVLLRTAELARSEARSRSLIQNIADVISVVGVDGTVRFVSPSVHALLGRTDTELTATRFADLLHADDRSRFDWLLTSLQPDAGPLATRLRVRAADGEWRDVETVGVNLVDEPGVEGYLLTSRDVTERTAMERQLEHQALHDHLTGLANRGLFRQHVGHAMRRAGTDRPGAAVLFLDLDGFKTVNDSLGHGLGDRLLVMAGERLRGCVRAGDLVARLGGDEFGVLLPQPRTTEEVDAVVARILDRLTEPFHLDGTEVFVNGSIGIAFSADAANAEELLQIADVAMYSAKSQGKGRAQRFEAPMRDAVRTRLAMRSELQHALARGEFEVWYQPVQDLRTGRPTSAEALIRWRSPGRGLVPPLDFIPLAEESGLIDEIGAWVLDQACGALASWRAQYAMAAGMTVSVNVSGRQLQSEGFPECVARALAAHKLEPGALVLEVTESLLLEGPVVLEALYRLKALGVSLAIDDFGTGYSSLGSLRELPFDVIKVDRSFVTPLDDGDERGLAFVRTIGQFAHSLGLETVAEGVETPEQLARLRMSGLDQAQGYLLGRPVGRDELERTLLAPVVPLAGHSVA